MWESYLNMKSKDGVICCTSGSEHLSQLRGSAAFCCENRVLGVPVVGAWGVGDVSYGFQMVSDFKVSNFWQTVGRKVALELKCTAWINLVLTNMLQAI